MIKLFITVWLHLLNSTGMEPRSISLYSTRVNRGQSSKAFCQAIGWPVTNITIQTTDAVTSGDVESVVNIFTRTSSLTLNAVTENTTINCLIQNDEGFENRTVSAQIYCKIFFLKRYCWQ